ncbi:MAG TPA: YlaH-like family protein [Savagea sp.]
MTSRAEVDSFVSALDRMTGVSQLIYAQASDLNTGGLILFAVVLLLSAFVYKLGFAQKIKWWQNIIVYVSLAIGCLILTFLAIYLPVVEGLLVASGILIIYRIRRIADDRREAKEAASA